MSTKPNVVFLDVDGVICTPRASLAVGNVNVCYSYLDPIACGLVKRLCEQHNAQIVISSAWRVEFNSREQMEAILNAACANLGNYIWRSHEWWCTPNYVYEEDDSLTSHRGREIKKWIDTHATQFNNFCIIDDMEDMRPLQDSLVHCVYEDGMGWFQYHKAANLLSSGKCDW